MDYVPFTLFFMVCLLNFQENVMGKPATDVDMKAIPDPCEKQLLSRNYCDRRPIGYPSDEELELLYHQDIDKFNFRPQINETGNRDGEGENICREKPYLVEHVYMIRDERKEIRYALYLPKLHEIAIPVKECKPNANKMLDSEYKHKIKCVQKSFQYPYIVLSRDMKSLESVNILGLHSSCEPVPYEI